MADHTKAMTDRAGWLRAKWKDEGGGYWSLSGIGPMGSELAYVAIPAAHPLVGMSDNDLPDGGPDVNGGITFADGNVFGWDYGHADNEGSPETDIPIALAYFRHHSQIE